MFGFLNVYKPAGMTSHDVVAHFRRLTKVKQIGHTGTLDPFAEGVLPLCIGKATKLIEYLNDDKAYIGTVKLGKSTDTFDKDGVVINTSTKIVNLDEIEVILPYFCGEIEQFPPMYSAIKVNGRKLYEYAREGKSVEIKSRHVSIEKLEVLNFNFAEQELELYIQCSKGTYIRSLANDIGNKLNTYGYLSKLVRVKAGGFLVENSIKLDDFHSMSNVEQNLINPLKYLNYPIYELNEKECTPISNGNSISVNMKDGITILTKGNCIVSVGKVNKSIFKPDKVFI